MSEKNRNDWTAFVAVMLIAFGVWMLARNTLGPWLEPVREALQFATRMTWPVAIIGLGVLLLFTSRKGGLSFDVKGKRIYRSRSDKMIGGVLGGLGAYLDFDPTFLRIGYVLLSIALGGGTGVVAYIVAMIVIPEEPGVAAATSAAPPAPDVPTTPPPGPPAPPQA